MDIFLTRNGQQLGPYAIESLEKRLAAGSVRDDDLAWTAGQADWVPLRVLLAEIKARTLPTKVDEGSGHTISQVLADDGGSGGTATQFREPFPGPKLDGSPGVAAPRKVRGSSRAFGAVAAAAVILGMLLLVAMVPKHVSVTPTGNRLLRTDPGYTFVEPDNVFNWKVKWAPGTPSPTESHVLAGDEPDAWRPAPGYERPDGGPNQEVVWRPGWREPEYPHVAAGLEPNQWNPDPGYALTNDATPTSPAVRWQMGERLPHMVSADRENYWTLDAGYRLAKDSTSEHPRAEWLPGSRHFEYAHVYASSTEGKWAADEGYQWVTTNPGDFRTFSPSRTWAAWRAAQTIDLSTRGISCSDGSMTAVIESARDGYAALDTTDVVPDLASHLSSVHAILQNGSTTMNTCLLAKNAGGVADIAAAGGCGLAALFTDQKWTDCMDNTKVARQVVDAAGTLASIPCDKAITDFGHQLDEIPVERRALQSDLRLRYGLELDTPMRMLSCR